MVPATIKLRGGGKTRGVRWRLVRGFFSAGPDVSLDGDTFSIEASIKGRS
jgi:hypothetical protein